MLLVLFWRKGESDHYILVRQKGLQSIVKDWHFIFPKIHTAVKLKVFQTDAWVNCLVMLFHFRNYYNLIHRKILRLSFPKGYKPSCTFNYGPGFT